MPINQRQSGYMRNLFKTPLQFIFYSNTFMALCAIAQTLLSYRLLQLPLHWPLLILVFAATMLIYNLSFIASKKHLPQHVVSPRWTWYKQHQGLIKALSVICLLACLVCTYQLNRPAKYLLGVLGLLSAAYSLPLYQKNGQYRGLRHIAGFKSALIALVWVVSCTLLPIVQAYRSQQRQWLAMHHVWLLLLGQWLFLFALTIPFDIRDFLTDTRDGLLTLPVLLGKKYALWLSQASLMAYTLLQFLQISHWGITAAIGLIATGLLSVFMVGNSPLQQRRYFYFWGIDGLLIVQFILVYVGTQLLH